MHLPSSTAAIPPWHRDPTRRAQAQHDGRQAPLQQVRCKAATTPPSWRIRL